MRDLTEHSITDEVRSRLAACGDPRAKALSDALIRHLHAFVREVEPTEAEWAAGVAFLTRVGQLCDDKRQEFILLSDALGVSMLVDAINHRHSEGATETTVLGPFYVEGPPELPLGGRIPGPDGEPLLVTGSVSAAGGGPLAGAIVDVWHADEDGFYDLQHESQGSDHAAMRARFRTDAAGRFDFWTTRPSSYPIPHDGPVGAMLELQGRHPYRPAHVHFIVAADGHERLVTHAFEEGDPYLDSDVVFGVKTSLVRSFEPRPAGDSPDGRPHRHLHYDFGLKPLAAETARPALGQAAA